MSSLTSTSTLAQVNAAYDDNASYAEDGSVTKCRAFITACRFLLRRIPARISHGNRHSIDNDLAVIQRELSLAQQWLAANQDAGMVTFADLGNFRE